MVIASITMVKIVQVKLKKNNFKEHIAIYVVYCKRFILAAFLVLALPYLIYDNIISPLNLPAL